MSINHKVIMSALTVIALTISANSSAPSAQTFTNYSQSYGDSERNNGGAQPYMNLQPYSGRSYARRSSQYSNFQGNYGDAQGHVWTRGYAGQAIAEDQRDPHNNR
jgi:hypothetical protein